MRYSFLPRETKRIQSIMVVPKIVIIEFLLEKVWIRNGLNFVDSLIVLTLLRFFAMPDRRIELFCHCEWAMGSLVTVMKYLEQKHLSAIRL